MQWKQFNTKYEISEYGDVKNIKTNRLLKPDLHYKGYLRVFHLGSRDYIHRIVATLYIDNPNNYPQVNHKDGNKLNNHYSNLEWCTAKYNNEHALTNGLRKQQVFIPGEHHPNAKLTTEQVLDIRQSNLKAKDIANKHNVSCITVYKIRQGKVWKDI